MLKRRKGPKKCNMAIFHIKETENHVRVKNIRTTGEIMSNRERFKFCLNTKINRTVLNAS